MSLSAGAMYHGSYHLERGGIYELVFAIMESRSHDTNDGRGHHHAGAHIALTSNDVGNIKCSKMSMIYDSK